MIFFLKWNTRGHISMTQSTIYRNNHIYIIKYQEAGWQANQYFRLLNYHQLRSVCSTKRMCQILLQCSWITSCTHISFLYQFWYSLTELTKTGINVFLLIPHLVASEHRWLVKAPRWIHSVPDVSGRQLWCCSCYAWLWNLHDVTNMSRL